METMKKANEAIQRFFSRYGKTAATLLVFFMLLGTAQVVEAQSGLKINSLSEVTDKAKEGADTILDVAKYILAAVLGCLGLCHLFTGHEQSPRQRISVGMDYCRSGHHGSFSDHLTQNAMRTMRKINKPIKFFGLSSGQFAIFMLLTALTVIVSIFKQLHPLIVIGIISGILFLSGLLFKTLKKEHKAGNPDYLTSVRIKSATPRQITDKRHIFKFILKQ